MIDRSMTALRTLRPDFDRNIFWFRDDLHQPYPISPMGMTTIQKHHAWGYHVASEQTQLPPSKGAHVKVYKGRVYLGFALIDDQEEVARRAREFAKLVEAGEPIEKLMGVVRAADAKASEEAVRLIGKQG